MNVALLIDIPALIVPDAPALVGAESLDFGGLRGAVARGGGLLSDLGVGKGNFVHLEGGSNPRRRSAVGPPCRTTCRADVRALAA